ncbi:hypothetical protein BaRGS_00006666 [Batillaria attramentaria]|uniref:Uncharacterized protein n=1 Tax=Batillaria attramentaria TaxID=370345 RepID=A0ABD0LQV2_9CAEN
MHLFAPQSPASNRVPLPVKHNRPLSRTHRCSQVSAGLLDATSTSGGVAIRHSTQTPVFAPLFPSGTWGGQGSEIWLVQAQRNGQADFCVVAVEGLECSSV